MSDSYNQEAVQEILAIAMTRPSQNDNFSRAQLLEIAEELGISHEDCSLAEQEWERRCKQQTAYQAFDDYRYTKLQQSTAKYLINNTFLLGLDLITDQAITWSLYIIFSWGLVLALNVWRTYQIKGANYEKAFQQWKMKQQVNQSIKSLLDKGLRRLQAME
ncbi:MAG: 2TM domain-containing protein [Lyngbya sp. HA4199-MV5]|nr:2TM domain-containing protein [Lyngbya sp. HA4199-MV5]